MPEYDYTKFVWIRDWYGHEVGHPSVPVVGLYRIPLLEINVYVDVSTGWIIEAWVDNEGDHQ